MLETLRLFANSWLAKIFLFILLMCFVFIWGIPLYKGSTNEAVLTSGNISVSTNEFIFQINKYLYNLSMSMGGNHRITANEAESTGALNYFNSQLNFNALLDEQANELNLNLSNNKVAEILAKDSFFNSNNNFNINYFKNYINQLGIMQDDVIKVYKKQGKRQQLIDSLATSQKLPQIFFDAAAKYFNEKYNVNYITITENNLLPIKTRSDTDLKNYYNKHKKDYVTNELRTIELFTLSKDKLVKQQIIKDEDIKADFDKNIAKYTQDEKRDYDLLTFTDMKDASKALTNAQISFKDNKKIEHHKNVKKTDLSPSLAKAIFELMPDKYSNIIKDGKKFYIAKLIKITPKSIKALKDVSAQIKSALANKKASEYFNKTAGEIKDKLKTDANFKDIAKAYNLTVETHIFDKNGDTKANSIHDKAIDKSSWDKIIRASFHAAKGKNHVPVNIKDGGRSWYNVADIIPSKQKTFVQVKDSIKQTLLLNDKKTALDKRAQELKKELDNSLSLKQLATENNLEIKSATGIGRSTTKGDYTKIFDNNTITNILSHKLNENLISSENNSNKRSIIKITKIYNDKKKETTLNAITIKQFNEDLKNDLLFGIELVINDKSPLIIHKSRINYILSNMR